MYVDFKEETTMQAGLGSGLLWMLSGIMMGLLVGLAMYYFANRGIPNVEAANASQETQIANVPKKSTFAKDREVTSPFGASKNANDPDEQLVASLIDKNHKEEVRERPSFSYYAVLNLAIVVIAWFKSWRALNLLGFAFTFIIGTVWGVFSYTPEKFATTEPFLILFFLFYVLIAVFFALREPQEAQTSLSKNSQKLQGYVDGTLLFGVPLAASGLQYAMVLSVCVGISVLVPFVGVAVVTIPVVLVAGFQWGWSADFAYLVIAYIVIMVLDANLLVPLLFSEVTNLHPVAIIVAVLLFGGLWGFLGLFFAIPLANLVQAVINAWPKSDHTHPVVD